MSVLRGKNVLISGAGGGIGRAVTLALLREGANVHAVDLNTDALEAQARSAEQHRDALLVSTGDATDVIVVDRLAKASEAAYGPVDVLVNVAGTFVAKGFAELRPADWALAMDSNLRTTSNFCARVIPAMQDRASGSVINFASTAGEFGSIRPAAHYAAAKGAVIGYTKSVAREVAGDGVRVNCISPGPIDTGMFSGHAPADAAAARSEGASRTLVGRMGTPDDIASGVIYLASDGSAFVTGTILQINGGSRL